MEYKKWKMEYGMQKMESRRQKGYIKQNISVIKKVKNLM